MFAKNVATFFVFLLIVFASGRNGIAVELNTTVAPQTLAFDDIRPARPATPIAFNDCCRGVENVERRRPSARRYDINDVGYDDMFHGWADVQGLGAPNDYCRLVGHRPNIFLSCALGGTHGDSEHNYVSAKTGFDVGYTDTWYMKDEDGDGRDDYCRCVGNVDNQMVVCTRAGPRGFHGSAEQGGNTLSFTPTGPINCAGRRVRPEFGRLPGFII